MYAVLAVSGAGPTPYSSPQRPHREKENSLAPTSGCTAMETEGSWLRLACAHMSGTRKTSPASCSHE